MSAARLRNLYVMGDVTKDGDTLQHQAIEEGLERVGPPLDPQLDRAEAVLRGFSAFWDAEPRPAERRKLIASLFDRVWKDEGQIVAVRPRGPFLRYFRAAENPADTGNAEAGFNRFGRNARNSRNCTRFSAVWALVPNGSPQEVGRVSRRTLRQDGRRARRPECHQGA